jgi:hypothetical protein
VGRVGRQQRPPLSQAAHAQRKGAGAVRQGLVPKLQQHRKERQRLAFCHARPLSTEHRRQPCFSVFGDVALRDSLQHGITGEGDKLCMLSTLCRCVAGAHAVGSRQVIPLGVGQELAPQCHEVHRCRLACAKHIEARGPIAL